MLDKPQLNTVDPLIDLVVAYAKAIHAPNIAFGCATTVIFFQFFNFLFVFVVFRRLLGGRFWLLATAGVGRLRRRRAEPAGGLMARRPSPEGRASTLRGRRREAGRRGGLPPRPATRRRGRRGAAGAASGVERVGVRRAGPRAKGNSAAVKAVEQRLAHRPYGDGGVAGDGPRRPDPFPSRLEDPLRQRAGYARQNCLIRASIGINE
jgi:hypothetical protein